MALTAVLPQTTIVDIILGMAGITVLRLRFEISDGPCAVVAVRASQGGVFPLQWKGDYLVIEILPVGLFAIMAIQTANPISRLVSLVENGVQLVMAVLAYAEDVL